MSEEHILTLEDFDTVLVTPLYNVTSIKLISARIPGFSGTYIKLKMSIGDDVISQKIITKEDCHYFGKLIMRGDLWDNSTDEVLSTVRFKNVDVIHMSFEYPDGSPFVPVDWVLKCKLCGTMDKMCLTKGTIEKEKQSFQFPKFEFDPILLFSIGFLIIGFLVMLFSGGPKAKLP